MKLTKVFDTEFFMQKLFNRGNFLNRISSQDYVINIDQ